MWELSLIISFYWLPVLTLQYEITLSKSRRTRPGCSIKCEKRSEMPIFSVGVLVLVMADFLGKSQRCPAFVSPDVVFRELINPGGKTHTAVWQYNLLFETKRTVGFPFF